ncbi:WYL domain-containing protein [Phormidium tenue FACHB-886]|nr:WYL domain-containing protein [Phormidium tenue FACHB-886]
MGSAVEQQEEQRQQQQLIAVTVRFFEPVLSFLLEGERRHPTQKIRKGLGKDGAYVDYSVSLPKRSLSEFGRWVNRFMENARILAPVELAEQHRRAAEHLVNRYRD